MRGKQTASIQPPKVATNCQLAKDQRCLSIGPGPLLPADWGKRNAVCRIVFALFVFLSCPLLLSAQEMNHSLEEILPPIPPLGRDTLISNTFSSSDTLLIAKNDSVMQSDSVPRKNALDAPVSYQSTDSIVMTAGNWAYIFGEGVVKYQNIELQSETIEMNMDSSIVFAKFGLDSIGEEFGYPIFKEGEQQYESRTMRYNFKSRKGYISDVVTQQGEGFVTAERTKKMESDVMNMVNGRYTTCDHHDHPHFYIQITKGKIRPHKNIVTGPVYLVIEDVPLPLALPFAFFPFSSSYQSGIIMPSYGDESARGFSLRDGGYYFAISDYVDLALTGEIYTKGSWGLSARSSYRKRYKFSGNFNASYQVTKTGDKIKLPPGVQGDYSLSKDFKVNWTHTQDAKANPYRTFSASVNFATSSFDRNSATGYLGSGSGNYADATQNTKGSSVSITQRFPNSPFSISGTMNINQRSKDSAIAVTLPDISITMNRIYPFKRKNAIGKDRWYEKISMSYTGYLRNSIDTKEDLILKSNLVKDWRNAMQHTIPVSATFNVLKYINISPSFNYKERWYTSKIEKTYDPQLQRLAPTDTTYGFYRLFDYSASVSASTTLYGNFIPIAALQKWTKVKHIRHRFEPSISLSATPDFGSSRYGYYETYHYIGSDGKEVTDQYSPFAHNQFGTPGRGKSGSINFSLDNNLEMKIISARDSSGERKISLIDKLSLGMSYNMAVDTFQWSDLNVGLRLKLSKSYTLNLTGVFDTYTYEAGARDEHGTITTLRKRNVLRWNAGKGIGRLRSTGTSFSYTFNNETLKKLLGRGSEEDASNKTNGSAGDDAHTPPDGMDTDMMHAHGEKDEGRLLGAKKETGEYDSDGYLITSIPWSLSFSYSMRLGYNTRSIDQKNLEYKYAVTHSLSFNGNIQPTKNWRLNFNATYDFDQKKISFMTCNISRDLHCFQMTASFVPVGPYKSYSFSVAVSSALLKDLKYDQSSNYRDALKWY